MIAALQLSPVVVLLFDLALIVVLARVFGGAAERLGQPPVLGEIVAGILLGPTLLGDLSVVVFPLEVRPMLSALANVGLAIFMFMIGLELNHGKLRNAGRLAASVSAGSIVLPFGLGLALAMYLAGEHGSLDPVSFSVFLGAAMSVTAFPVLARILSDNGLQHTSIGRLALTSAAAGDVVAWILLAAAVWLAGGSAGDQWRIALVVPYVLVMLLVVRPVLGRYLDRHREERGRIPIGVLALLVAGMFVSASLTEWFGLHFIFGAFFFGAVIPHKAGERLRTAVRDQVSPLNHALLLPVFFVVAGFQVSLRELNLTSFVELGLILLVACGGKFLGVFLGTWPHKMSMPSRTALAALMNTRGLTELVILGVGLQLGLLDQRLYSLMVLMAVLTTLMAAPILWATGYRRPADTDTTVAADPDGHGRDSRTTEIVQASRAAPGNSTDG